MKRWPRVDADERCAARRKAPSIVCCCRPTHSQHGAEELPCTQQRHLPCTPLTACEAPRGRLARDQCIPAWALLAGGLGKPMMRKVPQVTQISGRE